MAVEWLLTAGFILLLDQVSKEFVLRRLEGKPCFLAGSVLRIRIVNNPRIGIGLTRDVRVLIFLWVLSVLGMILLIQHNTLFEGLTVQIAIGALIGGAAGNLIDILRRGAVIDFIDLRIWPVFNLADLAIVLGMIITLWSLVKILVER